MNNTHKHLMNNTHKFLRHSLHSSRLPRKQDRQCNPRGFQPDIRNHISHQVRFLVAEERVAEERARGV